MQVDQRGPSGGACVSFGHADDDLLVQTEDEAEVVAEPGEERQFVRARVAEDRRHPVGTKDLQTRVEDCLLTFGLIGHCASAFVLRALAVGRRGMASLSPHHSRGSYVPAQPITRIGSPEIQAAMSSTACVKKIR